MRRGWRWAGFSLALVGGVAEASCSGTEFCADSKTCPLPPEVAGQAGANTAVGDGGSDAGGGSVGEGGGAGGESTIGMPCSKDAECDDKDSCSGTERCTDGVCAAGEAVQCPNGLVCSAAQDNACVFETDAPWILFRGDAEKKGTNEVFGVKPGLIGKMDPVKVSPALASGEAVYDPTNWSPDGARLILTTIDQSKKERQTYLVDFSGALPQPPIQLTKGLPASATSVEQWSPSSNALAITRDDGTHVFDLSSLGDITDARASGDAYSSVSGASLKSDDELVFFGKNAVTGKFNWVLATRSGGSWGQQTLVADVVGFIAAFMSPDRSLLVYETVDKDGYQNFWLIETAVGSQATKIAGPSLQVYGAAAPDASRVLLASTATATLETEVRGGTLAQISDLPLLQQHFKLTAQQVIGTQAGGPWAPDSSRAALFQDGAFGRQVVVYQPAAAEPWHSLPLEQATTDPGPSWSPTSMAFVLPTRSSAGSNQQLTFVSTVDSSIRALDTAPAAGSFSLGPFAPGGDFFVYAKGSGDGMLTDGYYVDLRQGIAKAPKPLPIPGVLGARDFASQGGGLVYVDGDDCMYLDLAADAPEPAQVNPTGTVLGCSFQKLPR